MAEAGCSGEDELALARRAGAGDAEAFGDIVRAYEGRLLAYLTQMLGDPEAARDVAQETFIAAYQALPRWRPPSPPAKPPGSAIARQPLSPWLYRIATNRALSLLRARPARRDTSLADAAGLSSSAHGSSLEDAAVARVLLGAALRQLGEEDAACLVLHYVSCERYGEIAERLGLTSEAVRKRVARGLVALRVAYRALDVEVPA